MTTLSLPEGLTIDALRALVRPYFQQGDEIVHVATCCGRVFAGTIKPTHCRDHPDRPLDVFTYKVAEFPTQ